MKQDAVRISGQGASNVVLFWLIVICPHIGWIPARTGLSSKSFGHCHHSLVVCSKGTSAHEMLPSTGVPTGSLDVVIRSKLKMLTATQGSDASTGPSSAH